MGFAAQMLCIDLCCILSPTSLMHRTGSEVLYNYVARFFCCHCIKAWVSVRVAAETLDVTICLPAAFPPKQRPWCHPLISILCYLYINSDGKAWDCFLSQLPTFWKDFISLLQHSLGLGVGGDSVAASTAVYCESCWNYLESRAALKVGAPAACAPPPVMLWPCVPDDDELGYIFLCVISRGSSMEAA